MGFNQHRPPFLLPFGPLQQPVGFHRAKLFENFPIFQEIWPNETPHRQNWPNFAKFCLFGKKARFFAQNPLFFLNFGAFGAEI